MKKLALIATSIALLLCGCGISDTAEEVTKAIEEVEEETQYLTPSMKRINSYRSYSYLVDENTGVVYLEYNTTYRHAITVMLNADGTPITAEQLGIEY